MIENILGIINSILNNKSEAELASINENDNLRENLNLDSFDLVELSSKIEEKYNVDIFSDGLVHTVGEILNKLK